MLASQGRVPGDVLCKQIQEVGQVNNESGVYKVLGAGFEKLFGRGGKKGKRGKEVSFKGNSLRRLK